MKEEKQKSYSPWTRRFCFKCLFKYLLLKLDRKIIKIKKKSEYHLKVNENTDDPNAPCPIIVLEQNDSYDYLISVPIRDHNDFYTLGDILANKPDLIDAEVNLQCLVRNTIL